MFECFLVCFAMDVQIVFVHFATDTLNGGFGTLQLGHTRANLKKKICC